ncbi:DUF6541 family protein [Tomitella biformata]|uniref:DUF6541 family protein n=1 Tax=Tomitella biformata TaxID=630403 RepID=UPI0004BC3649|nr:DUF6541 family protein [Tomitella biformata]
MLIFGVPAVLVAVCVLFLPGAALGWSLGLRGRLLWGVAPALTLGFTGLAAISYSGLGITWAPIPVLAGVAAVCAVLAGSTWLLRWRWPGLYPHEPAHVGRVPVALAIAAASAIAVTIMLTATRGLTRIPQGWDALLHGTASRLIEQSGDASPFALADAAAPGNAAFYYPDAFHALTALVLHVPGQSMPGALNAMVTATAIVFIFATVALVSRIDPRPLALSAAAVLAASFSAFPVLQAAHGPLSPFALGAAAMPGVLAVVFALLRRPSAPLVLAAALGMSGLYVTHPSIAAMALILIAIIGVCWLLWGGRTRTPRSLVTVLLAGLGAVALTLPSVDTASKSVMNNFDWPAEATFGEAAAQLLGMRTYVAPQWLLFALAVAGLWALGRRRELRPLVIGAAAIGWLFVIAAASDAPYVQTLTSLWWNDAMRFLGLYAVMLAPIVACGVVVLVKVVARLGRNLLGRGRLDVRWVGVVAVVALAAISAAFYAPRGVQMLARNFQEGVTVYPEEAAAYAQLAELYDGGAIMNDPYDGSPWMYTLETLPILVPGPLGEDPVGTLGQDRMDLYADIHSYGHNPYMADIVERLDVRWLVVGEGSVGGMPKPPGFAGIAENPAFEPVIVNDRTVIYRLVR